MTCFPLLLSKDALSNPALFAISFVLMYHLGVTAQEVSTPGEQPSVIPAAAAPDPNETTIRQLVLSVVPDDRYFKEDLSAVVVKAYADRGFRPLWGDALFPESFHLVLSKELSTHGFPSLLSLDPAALAPSLKNSVIDPQDLAYTVAILDSGMFTRLGAVAPQDIWSDWLREDTPGSMDNTVEEIVKDLVLATSIKPFDTGKVLDQLAPKNWIYREFREAYPASREAILKYSGLPAIPDPATAGVGRPGEAYPYAPAIGAHLADRGYLKLPPEQISALSQMTPELVAALVAFQTDYGLDPDGIFGSGSWRYLNTNAVDQYRSLTINLHRARLLPNDFGDRYLLANLPCAELYMFEDNDFHANTMRIVHGKASKDSHRTPVFRDVMKEMVFGPYWNVPKSIAVKEVLPKAQADWGFLSRNRYEIVSDFNPYNTNSHRLSPDNLELVKQGRLFLRQKPGPTNALGHVKFLFPNSFNVYMHDTPSKSFFARSARDHSHGCIRVSKPEELGAWVLKNEGWTEAQVKEAMFADVRKSLPIKEEINVYITYFTTFPRPVGGGRIVLAPSRDVYEMDPIHAQKLNAVIPWREAPPRATPVTTTATSLSDGQ
ncbi:MAG: L,D-transpeptidase family protein [Verrucomicrobiales bacterium]|nr:L,D-transpeptidase family protein [Verrucomicrobiales bacterium]